MEKQLEKILEELEKILEIVLHNNNLAGFISNQVSPIPPDKADSLMAKSSQEMAQEVFRNNAQYEVIGEA